MSDIRERKRLKPRQQVLDHMGSTELAANLFRATPTEEKLRRENVRKKELANNAAFGLPFDCIATFDNN